jgi:hypothetical protein
MFTSVPVVVTGTTVPIRRPTTPALLSEVTVPGILLQGGRLDLALRFDPADAVPPDWEATVEGAGVRLEPAGSDRIRLAAAVDAPAGWATVCLQLKPPDGPPWERRIPVLVRPPFTLRAAPGPLRIRPGSATVLGVSVERQPGFEGPVQLRIEGLPKEIRLRGKPVLPGDRSSAALVLTQPPTSEELAVPVRLGIVGTANLPGGTVEATAPVRPMLGPASAEE